MKSHRSAWTIALVFAIAHGVVCVSMSAIGLMDLEWNPWVFRVWSWLLAALALPLLMALHEPSMSRAETFALIAANSAAAGLIFGLFFVALRRGPSGTARKAVLACLLFAILTSNGGAQSARESTVGIPARITDLVLPGSELEVLPQDAKTAVVLRITRVAPHGTDMRYDIEWTGLDAGRHDLRAFLRRKDGTDTSKLPEIPVEVRTTLAPGFVKPNHPPVRDVPRFGGYRAWMIGLGIAWTIGLVVIGFALRKKRAATRASAPRPRTLAERLRPLVESAMAGRLSGVERAQLELGLVAHWRRRLGLDAMRPEEAQAVLRRHAEAGPLLNQLDAWLHKPGVSDTVDVNALLAPYKDLPPDALDEPTLDGARLARTAFEPAAGRG